MKRALVLSGGGSHGSVGVGALDYLVNVKGLDFDILCGVSTGTLTAAMLAQAPPGKLGDYVSQLHALYTSLKSDHDIYLKRWMAFGSDTLAEAELLVESSEYTTHPIATLIAEHVDLAKLKASGRQLRFGTVCLETGAYVTWSEQSPDILAAILASASMPIYFPPVEIQGLHYCDGGVTHVTPLADAFALKPDEMWVILCDPIAPAPKDASSFSTGLPILERVTDLLVRNVFLTDIQHAIDINTLILNVGQAMPDGKRHVPLYVVMPESLAGDTLSFDPNDIAVNLAEGYRVAQVPFDENAVSALLAKAGA